MALEKTTKKRKVYSSQFKLDRAIEALRDKDNVAEISRKYGLNSNLIYKWRDQLLSGGAQVFENSKEQVIKKFQSKIGKLEQMIGKKEVELNLIKNFSDFYGSKNTPL